MAELTIRDWMVIIGVLLIMAVLLDAWRRVRSDKYSRVKVKLSTSGERNVSEGDEDLQWLKELPNGGARTVKRGDLLRAAGHKEQTAAADAAPELADDSPDDSDQAEVAPDTVTAGMSAAGDSPENLDWLDGMGADRDTEPRPDPAAPGRLPRDIDPEVFMFNVVARDARGFKGEDILHILLACDLRFGDMNFFHRHEFEAGKGAIQFSVANMMQPGVFDIDNMADFNTPGLVFFLTLPGPEDMMKAFDYMLETAQAVARNLGGDVLDESRSVLTRQTLEHCRQQIRDLERRLLAQTR
ncbi:cell division protein ZipA [Seongchinamella sediminis]|uniref:Cell division protein ZipA n=1 Tax=Seongchinamella sediminis TaxID=2283635 RepID=A0A3L7E1Z9_9GAMM|nr:cell division protein ZipA [Seongchinamella sediminis]RLQ23009.1 cell division protein ZipA [Seongchinamella sediminis]